MIRPIVVIVFLAALGGLIYLQLPHWKRGLAEEVRSHLDAPVDTSAVVMVDAPVVRDTLGARAALMIGMNFYAAGQIDSAAILFAQAQALDPVDPAPLRHLAVVRARQGRPDESLRALEQALVRDSSDAVTWVRLGKMRAHLGERDAARKAWAQALALNPDHVEARHLLDVTDREGAMPVEAMVDSAFAGTGILPDQAPGDEGR